MQAEVRCPGVSLNFASGDFGFLCGVRRGLAALGFSFWVFRQAVVAAVQLFSPERRSHPQQDKKNPKRKT